MRKKYFDHDAFNALTAKRKMKDADLCHAAGITYMTLCNLSQGKHEPSLRVIVGVANALGVKVDYLLKKEG